MDIELVSGCVNTFALRFVCFRLRIRRAFIFFHFRWRSSHRHQSLHFFVCLGLFCGVYIFECFAFGLDSRVSAVLMSTQKLYPIFPTTMIRIFFVFMVRFIIDFFFPKLLGFLDECYMLDVLNPGCFCMMSLFMTRLIVLCFYWLLFFQTFLWNILVMRYFKLTWLWQLVNHWLLWWKDLVACFEFYWKFIRTTQMNSIGVVFLNIDQIMVIEAGDQMVQEYSI